MGWSGRTCTGSPSRCSSCTPRSTMSSQRPHTTTRAPLPRVPRPVLLMSSAVDHVVPAATNAHAVRDGVGSADVTEIVLDDSYHVATLDNDAERIEKESLDFVSRVSGGTGGPS